MYKDCLLLSQGVSVVTCLFLLDFPTLSLIWAGEGGGTFFSNFHRKGTWVVNVENILRFLHNLKCLYSALTQVWLGIELRRENDALSLLSNVVFEIPMPF